MPHTHVERGPCKSFARLAGTRFQRTRHATAAEAALHLHFDLRGRGVEFSNATARDPIEGV
jgi:hypothetical protein